MSETKQATLTEILQLKRDVRELKNELQKKKRRLRHLTYKTVYEYDNNWKVEPGQYSYYIENKMYMGKTYRSVMVCSSSTGFSDKDVSKVFISK